MMTYYVEKDDHIVDGNTFCDGRKCTSADTIIIRGGARGNLLLRNFDGNGSYIPILNENGASRVEITNDASAGFGVLSLSKCKYVDLRGDNDDDFKYGIHVRNCNPARSGAIRVYGESDHIKLGYLEVDCIGNTSISGIGIQTGDQSLDDTWIFDTFEIHHNYIHDTRYSGMYLGHNPPYVEPLDPYIANYSVHDNLLEDLGAYGITLKGVHRTSVSCLIYNNIIRGSAGGQSTGLVTTEDDLFKFGIGGSGYYGSGEYKVYNNWVEKTIGCGITSGIRNGKVYGNIICGCGIGNDIKNGNGIKVFSQSGIEVYDNIIIQPKRYGIFATGTTKSALMYRNLIGDAGLGEWYEMESGDLTESSGDDANWYESDVANFGFNAWSNDGNYSNDDFSFPTQQAKGEISNVDYPASVNHSDNFDINVVVKNIGAMSGIFKTQIMVDGTLLVTGPEFILVDNEISHSMVNQFIAPPSGDSMTIDVKCIRII